MAAIARIYSINIVLLRQFHPNHIRSTFKSYAHFSGSGPTLYIGTLDNTFTIVQRYYIVEFQSQSLGIDIQFSAQYNRCIISGIGNSTDPTISAGDAITQFNGDHVSPTLSLNELINRFMSYTVRPLRVTFQGVY